VGEPDSVRVRFPTAPTHSEVPQEFRKVRVRAPGGQVAARTMLVPRDASPTATYHDQPRTGARGRWRKALRWFAITTSTRDAPGPPRARAGSRPWAASRPGRAGARPRPEAEARAARCAGPRSRPSP